MQKPQRKESNPQKLDQRRYLDQADSRIIQQKSRVRWWRLKKSDRFQAQEKSKNC